MNSVIYIIAMQVLPFNEEMRKTNTYVYRVGPFSHASLHQVSSNIHHRHGHTCI